VNEPPGFTIGLLEPSHRSRVAEILRSTGNFRDDEIDVALELFDESMLNADYACVGAFETGTADRRVPAEGGRMATVDTAGRASGEERPAPSPVVHPPAPVGFAIYGPTMATDRTYDLYWIAVDRAAHGSGCGSVLLNEVERRLEALHARMLVVETSSRSDYTATRGFYLKRGYVEAARVREFYAPEDDRIILTKRLAGSPREGWGAVA
jgi:ribosomal protein S18 acetylase RimI-like enzyme